MIVSHNGPDALQMREFPTFSDNSLTTKFSAFRKGELLLWLQKHRGLVRVVIGGGLALVLCASALSIYWEQQRQRGLEELRKGLLALSRSDLQSAVSSLEHASRALPTGEAQQLSFLYLGEAYLLEKKPEMTKQAYEKIFSESVEGEPYIAQLALFKLGRDAEQRGDLSQARQWYAKSSAIEGPMKPDSLLATARVFEAMNDHSSALLHYEKLLSQHPDSPLGEIVRQKMGK